MQLNRPLSGRSRSPPYLLSNPQILRYVSCPLLVRRSPETSGRRRMRYLSFTLNTLYWFIRPIAIPARNKNPHAFLRNQDWGALSVLSERVFLLQPACLPQQWAGVSFWLAPKPARGTPPAADLRRINPFPLHLSHFPIP
jgi:hypothetical protein